MSQERDLLKNLLLKEELEVLNQLKQKVLSQEQFTQEVASVLATALKRAHKNDAELNKALYPPIKKGVLKAFSQSKQSIIDALLPIMGSLIRKTVSNSIKKVVADINRVLDQRLSFKALKWRWQALKAGVPYAEILFQKTIRYQVQEQFLINRNNGLLIEHAGDDELLKDNNAISAMLTVIQDFIRDSLQSPNADLLSTEIGDKVILISTGPQAFLASIIKGSVTERLKEKSQQLIENIHAKFSLELSEEDSYRNMPNVKEYLKEHLVLKNITKEEKKTNWLPWVVVPALIIAGFSFLAYKRNQQFAAIEQKAEKIEGFYLQSVQRQGNHFQISGLLDPLADISALQQDNITFKTKPFVSLDTSMVGKRIQRIVDEYPSISFVLNNHHLTLNGTATQKQKTTLLQRLNSLNGINKLTDNIRLDKQQRIAAILQNYQVNFKLSEQGLKLIGTINYAEHKKLLQQITQVFPSLAINQQQLEISDATEKLIEKINSAVINIPKWQQKEPQTKQVAEIVINNLHLLLQRSRTIELEIIGSSDCHGRKSDEYSQHRADFFKNVLRQKINAPLLITTAIEACQSFADDASTEKQNVKLKVKLK